MQKIQAKIHLKSIRDNAQTFVSPKRKLCAVVKANAYGHGAEEVVNVLQGVADYFAVALIEEGIAVRAAACGKEILVFTPPLTEEEVLAIAQNGFIATIPDLWTAKLVVKTAQAHRLRVKVHLKVNTGMNRYGMHAEMLGRVCVYLSKTELVSVEGIYSHLYTSDTEISLLQRERFQRCVAVCKRYYSHAIAHLGGTMAALLGEEFGFDMVRVGIGLYGYLPVAQECLKNPLKTPLKKGMTVYAVAAANRTYRYGGCGYLSPNEEKFSIGEGLTVCRFGYADGFLRAKANGASGGENANNLCMDVCLRRGKTRRGKAIAIMTNADETAEIAGTISYEVLCAVTRRAECIYEYD